MESKNRIAFIGYNLRRGGAERNIINLVKYFQQRGITADIILFKPINEYKKEYNDFFKTKRPYYLLDTTAKIPKVILPIKLIQALINCFAILSKKRYQILIGSIEYAPYYFAVFFAKLFGVRSIIIVGENLKTALNNKNILNKYIINLSLKITYLLVDKIICVSKGLTQDLIHTFPYVKKKVVTVYNGVDIKQVIKKENRLLSEVYDDNQIIINVARLVDKKGHQYLIESFKEVNKALPTSKLYLIGRGALFKHLQKIIKDNDLSSDVKLLKQANPYKHLPTATLFVFSSLYEGFGNAIIEAMVCGLPVIATDCLYGPKEILNGGKAVCPHKPVKKITYCKYGILVPPFDSNSENNIGKEKLLAKAILTLLINNKLRDHYKKMSWVRAQDFSLEKMGEGYFYVIKELFR